MRKDAIALEEGRLQGIDDISDYPIFKERHRIFPAIFEGRQHKRILDIAAGVGCAAQRVKDNYRAELICNDISPTCLKILDKIGISTVSFDIDDDEHAFPFDDGYFDAIISLVTIEHLIHVDHFLQEIHRMLCDGGCLYISTPNYAAPEYALPLLLSGKTFHDPLSESSRYEFYAHVRYFTYRTLLDSVRACGLTPEAVYLALPGGSTRYQALYARSKLKALGYRYAMWLFFHLFSPRWASEPIICCRKGRTKLDGRPRKVIL